MSPIIGRQLELATLETASLTERLVTLTGVGGIGKTRLAVELATRTAGRDKFGPYFVDLAPIGDVELVPAALAAALGVQVEPNADAMDARSFGARRSLRSWSVSTTANTFFPAIAELIGGLVSSSRRLRVVATSREPLDVAGERVCPVDPLRRATRRQLARADRGLRGRRLFLARLPMNVTARR